jgi:hypothetical protein
MGRFFSGIREILQALPLINGWSRLAFLLIPDPGLDDRTPLDAFKSDREAVLALAAGADTQGALRSVPPDDPDALPEPPPDLGQRTLPVVRREAGEKFIRLRRGEDSPIWFGWNADSATFRVATNRSASPDRRYGVLYVAATREGAFAESVGRKPRGFRSDDELARLRLTTLALTRDVRVVHLHGGAAVGAMGAAGVIGVDPQSLARRWAPALHDHPEQPGGIEYRCRHNSDELAVALFDRVGAAVVVPVDVVSLTSDSVWLLQMRARHQVWQPPP